MTDTPAPPEPASPVAKGRACGSCTLCCKSMEIPVFGVVKTRGVWCSYACSSGCRTYATRPEVCREFTCLWLSGAFDDEHRPDKTGLVMVPAGDGSMPVHVTDPLTKREHIALIAHEGQPGMHERAAAKAFIRALTQRGFVVQVAGTHHMHTVFYPSGFVRPVPPNEGALL